MVLKHKLLPPVQVSQLWAFTLEVSHYSTFTADYREFLMLCEGGSLAVLGFMLELLAVFTLRGARSFVMKLTLVALG